MIKIEIPDFTDPTRLNFIVNSESEKEFIDNPENQKKIFDKFVFLQTDGKVSSFDEYQNEIIYLNDSITNEAERKMEFKKIMFKYRNLSWTSDTVEKLQDLINDEFFNSHFNFIN